MALVYFPQIYPEELLYSVLARYHLHTGARGPAQTAEALFGCRSVIATVDLPGHLHDLVRRIPGKRGITVDRLIDSATLYPYFTAFQPAGVRAFARYAMQEGTATGVHTRLGIAAFRIPQIHRLRFCPECCAQMRSNIGELYWRRDHQLPGVFVCPEHETPLRLSSVELDGQNRHAFTAALRTNCPDRAPVAVCLPRRPLPPLFHTLALHSAALLINPPAPKALSHWAQSYRQMAQSTGFTRTANAIHQERLQEVLREFGSSVFPLLPGIFDRGEFVGGWPAAILRKHRKAFHPLQHLIIREFFEQQEKQAAAFGVGPWECHNPLACHVTDKPITSITRHPNHDNIVGVFGCECGYVYTRCLYRASGDIGPPRFFKYGPLLPPALRKMVDEKRSLRSIGRALHLDPKTVVRLVGELGIKTPWSLPCKRRPERHLSGHQRKAGVRYTRGPAQHPPQRRCAKPLNDWQQIDSACASTVEEVCEKLIRQSPPTRVTLAEIGRKLGGRDWLSKRKSKLPTTFGVIARYLESIEAFQQRRILWAIDVLDEEDRPVKAWMVMRKAGLRSDFLPAIAAELNRREFVRIQRR